VSKASEWLIIAGGCVFISMLGLSAYWEPDIRRLHFFQAWMYVATIVLAHRRNRWGYFIGFSAAGLWIYANLFATTFLAATAFSLGSHRPLGAGRFAYRSASMVFEPACGHWLRLGILSGSHTISARRGQTSG
jgi:hypothetical protein